MQDYKIYDSSKSFKKAKIIRGIRKEANNETCILANEMLVS